MNDGAERPSQKCREDLHNGTEEVLFLEDLLGQGREESAVGPAQWTSLPPVLLCGTMDRVMPV